MGDLLCIFEKPVEISGGSSASLDIQECICTDHTEVPTGAPSDSVPAPVKEEKIWMVPVSVIPLQEVLLRIFVAIFELDWCIG